MLARLTTSVREPLGLPLVLGLGLVVPPPAFLLAEYMISEAARCRVLYFWLWSPKSGRAPEFDYREPPAAGFRQSKSRVTVL